MTALTYMIDSAEQHQSKHPWDSMDMVLDRVHSDCEYVGIDFAKVSKAAFGGVVPS